MCDIIVSNLPTKADVYFLNTLFDRQVKDSIWAGYGTGRFAIVSLKSSAYGERLLEAQRAFLSAKALGFPQDQKKSRSRSSKKSTAAAGPDEAGLSVEELLSEDFTAATAATSSGTGNTTTKSAGKKSAAAGADDAQPIEVHPFYGDICCDDRILFFDRSPISVDEILATQRVPGRVEEAASAGGEDQEAVSKGKNAKKKTPRTAPAAAVGDVPEAEIPAPTAKKTRVEAVVATTTTETDDSSAAAATTTTEVATEKRQRHKVVKPKSTRLTFGDDEDGEQHHAEEKGEEEAESAKPAKKSSPNDSGLAERRPSSSAPAPPTTKHTSNSSVAAAGGPPQAQPVAAPAAKPAPQLFARTSKDQCKFCGSDLHLSRHCPQKA